MFCDVERGSFPSQSLVASSVTIPHACAADMVNTVPAPYKNMHVVALRQFCMLLAQKPSMPAMQIQPMFGTYDPAEYQ